MKKAQSISINTIVVAAIALIVLILIVLIFTQNIGNWRQSTTKCESNNGICIAISDTYQGNVDECETRAQESSRLYKIGNYECYSSDGIVDKTQVCCILI